MHPFPTRSILKVSQFVTGRQILRRYDALMQSQWLNREELQTLQFGKLQRLVDYAYQHVPFYRRSFDRVGFQPGDLKRDPTCFEKLPIVTKQLMRENPEEFFSDDPKLRNSLRPHHTSGSTGEPFTFWEDLNKRDYVTAETFRTSTWSGWKLGEPLAYLWGGSGTLEATWLQKLRSAVMNFTFNQFCIDAYDLSRDNLLRLVGNIRRRQPTLLVGYTTALYTFARFVRDEGLSDIQFRGVISTAEVLFPHQRKLIEETFRCQVFNRYSTTEVGIIASECEAHSGMHISMENCYVEIFKDNHPVADDQPGEIVVTNLNNYGFPFIRYQLKDTVQRSGAECSCGRKSPLMECVHGRTVDLFHTTDGRVIWGDLEPSVFQVEGIRQCQVVQRALDLLLIRVVKDETFGEPQKQKIVRVVKKIMGENTRVEFEFPDQLPQLKSGKFRYAYSELSGTQPEETL
jgi:phenylacetate-CoA ligase